MRAIDREVCVCVRKCVCVCLCECVCVHTMEVNSCGLGRLGTLGRVLDPDQIRPGARKTSMDLFNSSEDTMSSLQHDDRTGGRRKEERGS